MNQYSLIQELLNQRADLQARLKLLPYVGTPEVKTHGNAKYLYIRKRVLGKLTSTYVGQYSDELYNLLLRNSSEAREIQRNLRKIDHELSGLGYSNIPLSPEVIRNIDFARANLKANIYDQVVLEGVATSLPQTAEIIDNGIVNGMASYDVQKILNLKHAWEFILDNDVISSDSNYYLLCHIAKLVNEGFYTDGGKIRTLPVTIGGTNYLPPIPIELEVKDKISEIIQGRDAVIDKAIKLFLYCMKTQIFLDGNKRASVIYANHFLVSHGGGLIVVPENDVSKFKQMLVRFYEGKDIAAIQDFMKSNCWKRM